MIEQEPSSLMLGGKIHLHMDHQHHKDDVRHICIKDTQPSMRNKPFLYHSTPTFLLLLLHLIPITWYPKTTPIEDRMVTQHLQEELGNSDVLLSHATGQHPLEDGDIRRVLSAHKSRQASSPAKPKSATPEDVISFNGKQFRAINTHKIQYRVHLNEQSAASSALIDRGANGGLAGADVRVIERTDRMVDITGIDGHQLNGLPIVTVAGKVQTTKGMVVLILHQYAYLGQGKTIHSPGQMEMFDIQIDDKSRKVGGKQLITTLEGYQIPIHMRGGLPYIDMESPSDDEMDQLPHVIMTSDLDWDPSVLDEEVDINDILDPANQGPDYFSYVERRINPDGSYAHRHVAQHGTSAYHPDTKPGFKTLWDLGPEDAVFESHLIDDILCQGTQGSSTLPPSH